MLDSQENDDEIGLLYEPLQKSHPESYWYVNRNACRFSGRFFKKISFKIRPNRRSQCGQKEVKI